MHKRVKAQISSNIRAGKRVLERQRAKENSRFKKRSSGSKFLDIKQAVEGLNAYQKRA